MPEERFWRTTPRKLHALLKAHAKAIDPEEHENKPKPSKGSNRDAIKAMMSW